MKLFAVICTITVFFLAQCSARTLDGSAGVGRSILQQQQPETAWITPQSGSAGCLGACKTLGPTWRSVAGTNEAPTNLAMVLCAGLVDMPGLGKQWVAGLTMGFQTLCDIRCPTFPCWNLPAGATYSSKTVTAGNAFANVYKSAAGKDAFQDFPMKCACVKCVNEAASGCEDALWVAGSSASCPRPIIKRQGVLNVDGGAVNSAGNDSPSAVYSKICRSDEEFNLKGYTGWVDSAVTPSVCRGTSLEAAQYSVWCPRQA